MNPRDKILHEVMEEISQKRYPIWYFRRQGKSDLPWILYQLDRIPFKFRKRVSEKYERLFLMDNNHKGKKVLAARNKANTYLLKVRKRFDYAKAKRDEKLYR